MYTGGNSERVVGTWNRAHPTAGILIQTKTGTTPDGPDLSPDRVTRQLEHSIAVLGRVTLSDQPVEPGTPWAGPPGGGLAPSKTGRSANIGLSNVNGEALRLGSGTREPLQAGARRADPEPVLAARPRRRPGRAAPGAVRGTRVRALLASGQWPPGRPLGDGERPRREAGPASPHGQRVPRPATVGELQHSTTSGPGVSAAGLALASLGGRLVTAPVVSVSKESQWQGIHEASAPLQVDR